MGAFSFLWKRTKRELFEALVAWQHDLKTAFANSNGNDVLYRTGTLVLTFGSDEPVISDPSGRVNPSSPNSMGDGAWPQGTSRNVVVRLNPEQILQRTIRLPNTRLWALQKATQYELERISPLDSKRIVFDVHLTGRDRAARTALLAVRIIRRDLAEHIHSQCRQRRLQVAGLQFPDTVCDKPWRGFPVDRFAATRLLSRRRSTALLSTLALGLIVCTVAAAYVQGAAIERAVMSDLAAEKEQAAALVKLRDNIAAAEKQVQFFSDERRAPMLVALLTDLSGLVPNDAWTTDVELSRESVRIRGYAASASRLIGIFEDSQRFTKARFGAPLVRGPAASSERFDLTAEVESAL